MTGTRVPHIGSQGPRIFEETRYRLTIECLDGRGVGVVGLVPGVLANGDPVEGHPNLVVGELNFRSQVGFADFAVVAADGERVEVTVQVFPSKLDFAADYLDLVTEVASLARGLVFQYSGATYGLASPQAIGTASALEWAILLRHYLGQLESALAYVARRPHRQLERRTEYVPVDRIRRPSAPTFQAIRQRRGRGATELHLGLQMRKQLPVSSPRETLDNPENRWLRAAVVDIRRRLVELRRESRSWREQQAASGRDTARLDRDIAELDETERTVSRLLRLEPLRDATSQPAPGYSSLALMGRAGYREAFRAIAALRMSLNLETGDLQAPLQRLSTLYEYWCYLRIAGALIDSGATIADLGGFVRVGARGLVVGLSREAGSTIELVRGRERQFLRYGAAFKGLTGTQKPDIVVEVDAEGWPPLIVVFDAKYRVDASREAVERFGGAAPPLDAVNALHRYRDAIAQNQDGRISRPVVKGAALYPLGESDSVGYQSRPLYTSLQSLGIGALPFLPSNLTVALDWVNGTLASSPSGLSAGLAPHTAESERWRRELEQLEPVLVLAPPDTAAYEAVLAQTTIEVPTGATEPLARLVAVAVLSPGVDDRRTIHQGAVIERDEATRSVTVGGWETVGPLDPDEHFPDWGLATFLAVRLAKAVSDLGLGSAISHELVELQPIVLPPNVKLQRDGRGWLSARMTTGYPKAEIEVVGHRTSVVSGAEWVNVRSIGEVFADAGGTT
jgi:hypothetical protein